jgi:hypothetical protein
MTRLLPALLLITSTAALANGDDNELAWVVVRGDRGASMHGGSSRSSGGSKPSWG